MIRGAEAGKESREDGAAEEIEEGAAWGESTAPAVEQDKKKKEPEGNACAWRVRRERRERLSLFLTRKRFAFYRYARRKSPPKGVSSSFGQLPNSRNVRRFLTRIVTLTAHSRGIFCIKC
jgi:hypothetical protein